MNVLSYKGCSPGKTNRSSLGQWKLLANAHLQCHPSKNSYHLANIGTHFQVLLQASLSPIQNILNQQNLGFPIVLWFSSSLYINLHSFSPPKNQNLDQMWKREIKLSKMFSHLCLSLSCAGMLLTDMRHIQHPKSKKCFYLQNFLVKQSYLKACKNSNQVPGGESLADEKVRQQAQYVTQTDMNSWQCIRPPIKLKNNSLNPSSIAKGISTHP